MNVRTNDELFYLCVELNYSLKSQKFLLALALVISGAVQLQAQTVAHKSERSSKPNHIADQNEKNVMTTQGVICNDTYVKRGGKWLIAHRKSNFVWCDVREVGK